MIVKEELSTVSGLSLESFSCLRAPSMSFVALEVFPDDIASLKAGRSSADRTTIYAFNVHMKQKLKDFQEQRNLSTVTTSRFLLWIVNSGRLKSMMGVSHELN